MPTLEELQRRFVLRESALSLADRQIGLVHPQRAEDLISESDFNRDERLPYWADIWPSARVLGDVVARHQGDGRSAIELGCGSGFVACALSLAGYQVTASDYYQDALDVTAFNVARNALQPCLTMLLDWRSLPEALPRYDLVVAADVLYERPYAAIVAAAIDRTLADGGTALVADPGRIALEEFLVAAEQRRLRPVEQWTTPFAEGAQRHTIRLICLKRWSHAS